MLRNEPAIVFQCRLHNPHWHPQERPDHWKCCRGLSFGLSMGENVLLVLTKVSPCRQIQASVAHYLPLCVWSVTKSWVIDLMASDMYTDMSDEYIHSPAPVRELILSNHLSLSWWQSVHQTGRPIRSSSSLHCVCTRALQPICRP